MPWIRIDENAMDHPKFLALTDGAWRLWCEGLSYCQKHLTDGRIQLSALKGFRYYSPARLRNLTDELVSGKGPCWRVVDGGHVEVHDYLQWNDSRADVLEARDKAKKRRRKWDERNGVPNGVRSGVANDVPNEEITANVPSGVVCSEQPRSQVGREGSARETPRVAFDGRRLRIPHWQHEDMGRRLGAKASDFDLFAWYQRLDDELDRTGEAFADQWKFLQARIARDARLPLPNLMGREVFAPLGRTVPDAEATAKMLAERRAERVK